MSEKDKEIYEFGRFRLNVTERFLAHLSGERVPLSDKVFETLCLLVRNAGHLVNKSEFLDQVWAGSFVEENNLNKCIHAVRRALGEKRGEHSFIETVSKHGFRFVAEVRRCRLEESDDTFNQKDEFQPKTKRDSSLRFSQSLERPRLQKMETVVSQINKESRADENEAFESSLSCTTPKELSEQNTSLESDSAKPNRESQYVTGHRSTVTALALVAFLCGIGALGFYFYSSKRVSNTGGDKKTIAVLPLNPINKANRDEIYEMGVADSLIHKLGSIKGLIIRPLSATRKYADIEQDPLAAGREQKVDYVLASNYQLIGGKIKITAQLFNVTSGEIEETCKSEKDTRDVFEMQDAIADDLWNKLQARFITPSSNPRVRRWTTNEEAYRLYLHGRSLTYNRTPEDAGKAVEYFKQAVDLDPNFAPAYSGIAHAFIASGYFSGGLPREEYKKARESLDKALEIDPNLAEGYAISGEMKFVYE